MFTLNKLKINIIFFSIKLIILSLLITMVSIWIAANFIPLTINGKNIKLDCYQYFKGIIFILSILHLIFDIFSILTYWKNIKFMYKNNENKINIVKILNFVIKIIFDILLAIFLFLFSQRETEINIITKIYFQDKNTLIIFLMLLLLSFIHQIIIFILTVYNISKNEKGGEEINEKN